MSKRKRRWRCRRFVPWSEFAAVPSRLLKEHQGWHHRIYALVDGRDGCVRYVGATSRELGERLAMHRKKPTNDEMAKWLAVANVQIRLITWAPTETWERIEMHWIAWARARGGLLNVDPGGRYRDGQGRPRRIAIKVAKIFDENAKQELKAQRRAVDPWQRARESLSERLAAASRRQMEGGEETVHSGRMNRGRDVPGDASPGASGGPAPHRPSRIWLKLEAQRKRCLRPPA